MARTQDTETLMMALRGYELEKAKIEGKIADLRARLGTGPRIVQPATRKRHRISPEGRARIAAAQRKRWAAAKKSA